MKEPFQKRSKSGRTNISDVSLLNLFGHSVHVYGTTSYPDPQDYLHVFRLYMYLHISLNEKRFKCLICQLANVWTKGVVLLWSLKVAGGAMWSSGVFIDAARRHRGWISCASCHYWWFWECFGIYSAELVTAPARSREAKFGWHCGGNLQNTHGGILVWCFQYNLQASSRF